MTRSGRFAIRIDAEHKRRFMVATRRYRASPVLRALLRGYAQGWLNPRPDTLADEQREHRSEADPGRETRIYLRLEPELHRRFVQRAGGETRASAVARALIVDVATGKREISSAMLERESQRAKRTPAPKT